MRENVERRPLLMLGAGLVVGLTALSHPANLFVVLLLIALVRTHSARIAGSLGLGLGLLLTPAPLPTVFERTFLQGRGTVVSVPRRGAMGTEFYLSLAGRTWQVKSEQCPELSLGDEVDASGLGLPLREGSERYLELHGVSGRLNAYQIHLVRPGPWPWRMADGWRRSFEKFCDRWLPGEAAGLTKALCFDMSGELPKETTDRLKETGTIHIVSASGLHVLVVAAAALWALSRLPIPRGIQILLVAALLALYAGATGLNPPVVRAALMALIGMSAYLLRREKDALSAIGLTAVLYLLWQPRQVYDPGFQLSFITVGAMALFLHAGGDEELAVVRHLKDSLRLSWVAFVASAPLIAYHFGTVSIVTLPANLLIGLTASLAIVSAFTAHVVSFLVLPLGVGLASVVTVPMVGWVLWLLDHLGGHVWSSVKVPTFSAYWLPVVYGLLLLTWRQRIVQP